MTTARQDLRMLEIDASEADNYPDLIGQILRREIFGVLVRGVFPPEQLARVVARLEQGAIPAPMFSSHTFIGRTYGRVLRMADEDLTEYFDAAAQIGPALEAAFGEAPGYQQRLRGIVSALSGGRPLAVPSVGDREYAPVTVRVVDPGGTVGLHCGNLCDYLADADRFRDAIAPFFESADTLEARIEAVLSPIAGGASVEVARTGDGRGYLPASMRVLVEGDSLPIHYENGTTKYESMNQLLPHLDVETIMSFYVPVQLPDSGGILEVYTTDCSGDGDRIIADLGGPDRARSILAERGCIEVLPEIGDMLVFDGGRYYHVVTEIEGPRARWTLGGFFAYTKDHNRVLYWS